MKNLTTSLCTKNCFKIIVFLLFSLSFFNCSKNDDDPIVYPDENPLAAYIANSGFSAIANDVNAGDYEFGLVFSPNVNGKMKAITAKIPDVNSNLRVTIWDFDTKAILRTEVVNVSTANTVISKSIEELALQKDKKYLISMNSNDWFNRTKSGGGNTTYPITAGNIKFIDYLWKSGTSQTFPNNPDSSYYAGDVSFVFQKTN